MPSGLKRTDTGSLSAETLAEIAFSPSIAATLEHNISEEHAELWQKGREYAVSVSGAPAEAVAAPAAPAGMKRWGTISKSISNFGRIRKLIAFEGSSIDVTAIAEEPEVS